MIIIFYFKVLFSIVAGEKRLLLNDPDVIAHRLESLEQKVLTLEADLGTEKQTVQQMSAKIQELSATSSPSTHYTRWGKKSCGNNATLIYSGQVGGGLYSKSGNGANPLCLHHDVLWGNRQAASSISEIHGAEYEQGFRSGTFDLDVPCAVCNPNTGTTTIMIPGRNKCISGWNEQYRGYIAASYKDHTHTSSYVCVDENEDVLDAGSENDNGYLFYNTVARCGSLKCPPYKDGSLITCVVCSK